MATGELGPDACVNLMDQYRPAGKVGGGQYSEIDRALTAPEFATAQQMAADLGLRRLDHRPPHPLLRRLMVV